MRAVVLSSDPADGNARGWREQLQAHGTQARLLTGAPAVLPVADFVVAQLLLSAGRPPHPAWAAAHRYEQAGVPLLNSTATIALCADKWKTHLAWQHAGLPQPRTWRLGELGDWPTQPMLLKPRFGESARGIEVVSDRGHAERAAGSWTDEALVQEALSCRSVLRVHATQHRVLGAFARPAAAVPGLLAPDPVERAVPVGATLTNLARAAVHAVDGGLIGLDIIQHDGRLTLLEANPTFSLPVHLPDLLDKIVRETIRQCSGRVEGRHGGDDGGSG